MFSGNSSLVANLFSLKVAKSVSRGRRHHYKYTEEFPADAGAGRVRSIMRAATMARLAAMSDGEGVGGGGGNGPPYRRQAARKDVVTERVGTDLSLSATQLRPLRQADLTT